MGSLMAGWGSKSAILRRHDSPTKDEIDAYWKSKKKVEEEHRRAISNLPENIQVSKNMEPEKKLQKSVTMPEPHYLKMDVDPSLEQLIRKNGWWTKSNWAFLNEPPANEGESNKYTPQFHVANLGSSTQEERQLVPN